jgi:short-subunit dehydrogenase
MKDKVIILTGASSGIGAEMAKQLGAMGACLVLAARDEARLKAVAKEWPGALVIPTDVADQAACQALVEKTVHHFGHLDILINNAGVSMWTPFEEVKDLSIYETIMQVNYLGSVYLTHYALPHLKASKGLIVVVSSLAGKTGVPTRTGYSASKHALHGFFDSLRIELLETGVDVSMICPDFVTSEIRVRAFGPDGKPLGKSPVRETEVMTTQECARQIIRAISKRQREFLMSRRGRIGQWIKLIAPTVIDKMALKAIREGK